MKDAKASFEFLLEPSKFSFCSSLLVFGVRSGDTLFAPVVLAFLASAPLFCLFFFFQLLLLLRVFALLLTLLRLLVGPFEVMLI